eukprot:CAMPEP_0197841826 /NCGR_PEP_ID=MMETSP1437-20131217/46398_1 /TAXON_ID=49252 ORGANISM="Eucampia antarctica, Strain CCMP1452" /NCGR_SAMPLE_ID=MMETSP1437 /ASSEMBLY_ACC=CAM_ASM_001096 /LENGTH=422 /DNA_ID=CAMNT_0043451631 /DNA_START=92 /DNA_END=1360 /DNA_ORIENTATION=-
MTITSSRGKKKNNYNRLSSNNSTGDNETNDDEANENTNLQEPLTPKVDEEEEVGDDGFNVIILDSAQAKFTVKSDPCWTIEQFKRAGCKIHKISPEAQRLIYMGRLLQDSQTLKDCGIDEHDKIIHLFPKPQVVISNSNNNDTEDGEDQSSSGGAHVPQIIVDADEAERRSQILILSSHEIFEAQHRVKLCSFLLLVVCSMELLTLFTIVLGVPSSPSSSSSGASRHGSFGDVGMDDEIPPGEPTDTTNNGGANGNGLSPDIRTWQNGDYADLFISSLGFYVATLGIKATTENTVALAKKYFFLLTIVGIGWLSYYYYLNVQAEEQSFREKDEEDDLSNSDLYIQAFVSLLLPIVVWAFCFVRAYQFSRLLQEAQHEADERAIDTATIPTSDEEMANSDNNNTTANNDLHDLQLHVEGLSFN